MATDSPQQLFYHIIMLTMSAASSLHCSLAMPVYGPEREAIPINYPPAWAKPIRFPNLA